MAIESIDQELCNGCGICVGVCPEDVLRISEETGKAVIKYPEDCVACWACESFCPVECIKVTKERAMELPAPY